MKCSASAIRSIGAKLRLNMKVIPIDEKTMYRILDEKHDPPLIQNQKEEVLFQAEMQQLYDCLVKSLSRFGEEGDYYGISDFAVRPDLKYSPTVRALAPGLREFTITVITEKFYRKGYLKAVCEFLSIDARKFRVVIAQDFDPGWYLTIFLTSQDARLYCSNPNEAERLTGVLEPV